MSFALRPRPNLEVVRRLAQSVSGEHFTSAISLGELIFGAVRRGGIDLPHRIEMLVRRTPVLPFDERAARVYGPLKAQLQRDGTPLDEPDLRIASVALANGLTLVTGNERHFARVPGLSIENWLD